MRSQDTGTELCAQEGTGRSSGPEARKVPSPAAAQRLPCPRAPFPNKREQLQVPREFQEGGVRLNAAHFKQLILSALKDLHGEVGAALPVDVLTYEEKTLSAILRVSSSGLVKLWSALTLLGSYQNRKCAFRVIQTSPFLLALSGNSRELVLD
ncbi:ribonuclease P protein subunit p14 isoform X1 [Lepidochelys kempii]|uniref:ribonuclease P protein subunit p14 isoform X1 n=1 Tax=Lepidochelys kempii TaxID=8472 RepID=UPI003C6F480F